MDHPSHPADPRRPDVRIEFAVARAEVAQQTANRAAAEQWAAIADTLDEARTTPEVYVDPRVPLRPVERIEFAERTAAADLAVRLGMSESTVRDQGFDAETLRARLPQVWAAFRIGEYSAANARTAADLVRSLPDDPHLARAFDEALAGVAGLPPARFRVRARVLRERIHSVALAERHRAAAETRGVWIDNDLDGMALLSMKLPADVAHLAFARIDAAARDLARDAGEQRSLGQLRADVAASLLVEGVTDEGIPAARFSVAVTVPVMTLLGTGDEPATLDGYGPIDAATARRIAAHAPSFARLLTHPVTGALLDVDRASYRPPADLKRWLALSDVTCRFPGCGRSARTSDIDHIVDHQYGGPTRAANLAHLCRHHHRLKHMTRWTVTQTGSDRERQIQWTSPTRYTRAADPPPF